MPLSQRQQRPSFSHDESTSSSTAIQPRGNRSTSHLPENPPECSVGDLFRSRDAPSFFGSSYFGPQAAAKVVEAPAPDFSSGLSRKALAGSTHSFRDEGGPFSQIWDLLGLLPRKKSTVDRLAECFLRELNWAIDAVHAASFRDKYETFWSRKFGFDDFATIDLRWLALLFIVLAYGVLLDCPKESNNRNDNNHKEVQLELQETSLRFYWAARRAIVIAPTFYGESPDLVRAGVLVTRYLIYSRRVPESWLTTSFAMRMAQAQGMHIDGERWRLPRQKTETRRRLWSHLYTLDKTIALAIGRPFAIVDQQCLVKQASNVWLDDMNEDEAATAPEQPLTDPTLSLCSKLSHELAVVVGKIQERCFGLFTVSYDTVLTLDREITEWEKRLPPYFRLDDPDLSKDGPLPFLVWHRLYIHSMYHFARVTLHRPYLLRQSITNRYRHSHDVCIASACADLAMRLQYFSQPLAERLRWALGPHHLFNSALVLGIIVVRDPHSRRSQAILEDLAAYCEMQRNDIWVNEFALAEVKIVELCIRKARQVHRPLINASSATRATPTVAAPTPVVQPAVRRPVPIDSMSRNHPIEDVLQTSHHTGGTSQGAFYPMPNGPMMWDDPSYSFPEADDIISWEHVLNSIMQDKILGV
ncbi:hypothetical protein SLS62_009566 [Diatrype stigma]|uniref:Xylanolytic transcriptional activator regulatory domain-containing protein n=1 Tax=Diatrype stigma TaxID=117547 RepID=A0AAN9YJ71_9PEZI